MASSYTNAFIKDCCLRYESQEVRRIEQQSNFQIVFTDDSVYNLDEIILMRRREVGNTPMSIHVVDKDEDNYADVALVFAAIEHVMFNTDENIKFIYEQEEHTSLKRPVININDIVSYVPYENITDVPNYVLMLQTVLDPNVNSVVLQHLFDQIPANTREKDGYIQMNTNGDDNFFDILDIFDPDGVL